MIDEHKIVWMNLTGSGNETAAHLLQNKRMTIMFCAFDGKPMILRLYGVANAHHHKEEEFLRYSKLFPEDVGTRQFMEMSVELVQTSCGFGVPFMDYRGERTMLNDWATKQGPEGVKNYWKEKNTESIDGFETGMGSNLQD